MLLPRRTGAGSVPHPFGQFEQGIKCHCRHDRQGERNRDADRGDGHADPRTDQAVGWMQVTRLHRGEPQQNQCRSREPSAESIGQAVVLGC